MTKTTSSPYEKLARTLNKIPESFPTNETGVHIKLLKWIFTEDEADLASKMKLRGETVEELSSRLNLPTEGLADKLESMAKKGQIRVISTSIGRKYFLIPLIVGIYEEQLNRMDKEFAQIFEEYYQSTELHELFDKEPPIFRVIPVNRVIKTELTIYPFEIAEEIINKAKSFGIRECICKKQKSLLDEPCKYPTTVCLIFSSRENAFTEESISKPVTKERALDILREAEDSGLVHCSMNIQTEHNYICNCCTCCCAILRGLTELNRPSAFVKSNFLMSVDEELCTGCGTCVERCQFSALDVPEEICEVDLQRCVGCGVCAISCPEEALNLVRRHPLEPEPPVTIKDWMTHKAKSRQIDPSDLF